MGLQSRHLLSRSQSLLDCGIHLELCGGYCDRRGGGNPGGDEDGQVISFRLEHAYIHIESYWSGMGKAVRDHANDMCLV